MKKHSTTPGPYEQLRLEFPPKILVIRGINFVHRQYSTRAQAKRQNLAETIRARIFAYDDWQCRYCGEPADVIDHIVPWAYGGTDEDDNLVAACSICNVIAHDKVFDDFNAKRAFILDKRLTPHQRRIRARDSKCTCIVCGDPIYTHERDATRFLCAQCNRADLEFAERRRNGP